MYAENYYHSKYRMHNQKSIIKKEEKKEKATNVHRRLKRKKFLQKSLSIYIHKNKDVSSYKRAVT